MPQSPKNPDAAALAVPTEVFADHMIMRPPNRLKELAASRGGGVNDNGAVMRAEHALQLLSEEFDSWMAIEIERLEAARAALAADAAPNALDALYRAAHDLRGQAATFGFPLAGEIADGLCTLIERMGGRRPPQGIIDKHVASIRAIVRENAKGRDHPLGSALAATLANLRAGLPSSIEV
ncbi:MAG: Hpt domain-containing protein [Hansschlegelia sp.]